MFDIEIMVIFLEVKKEHLVFLLNVLIAEFAHLIHASQAPVNMVNFKSSCITIFSPSHDELSDLNMVKATSLFQFKT